MATPPSPPGAFATGGGAFSAAAGDLDGDGDLDLAVANLMNSGADVSVLFNDGHGAFSQRVGYSTGDDARGVAVADFDNDGLLDLAVANQNSDTVSILRNTGAGYLQRPATFRSPARSWCGRLT